MLKLAQYEPPERPRIRSVEQAVAIQELLNILNEDEDA